MGGDEQRELASAAPTDFFRMLFDFMLMKETSHATTHNKHIIHNKHTHLGERKDVFVE